MTTSTAADPRKEAESFLKANPANQDLDEIFLDINGIFRGKRLSTR